MNNTVSIVIPVYNGVKTIKRCIGSVIDQNYKFIEIIVVDDGSEDSTDTVIQEICNKNREIKYLKQKNRGVSTARNLGIAVATGKYITFLDADDWLEEDCIEQMVTALETTNSDYCFSDWYVETLKEQRVDHVDKEFKEKLTAEDLYRFYILNRYGCAAWAKLYKRELVEKYNIWFSEGLPYAEDYLFVLNYLSIAQTCVYINKPLLHYDCLQPGAAAKVRSDHFELQLKIEMLKEKIVLNSKKYKSSDLEILKISRLKSYVVALVYLKNSSKSFRECYSTTNRIVEKFSEDSYRQLIKKTNFKDLNKLYAYLGCEKQSLGITVLTMAIVFTKKLIGR